MSLCGKPTDKAAILDSSYLFLVRLQCFFWIYHGNTLVSRLSYAILGYLGIFWDHLNPFRHSHALHPEQVLPGPSAR